MQGSYYFVVPDADLCWNLCLKWSGSRVDQLGFVTNKGRIFGPYGGCGGGSFTVNSCLVRGMFWFWDRQYWFHLQSLSPQLIISAIMSEFDIMILNKTY